MKVMKWRNASPCIRRIYRSRRGNGDYVDYKTWHMGVSSSDPWSGLSRNVECTVEKESEREKNVIGSSVTVTPLMNFESTHIVHRLDTHFVISAMTVAPSWPFWLRWQIPQQSGFGFSMHKKKTDWSSFSRSDDTHRNEWQGKRKKWTVSSSHASRTACANLASQTFFAINVKMI